MSTYNVDLMSSSDALVIPASPTETDLIGANGIDLANAESVILSFANLDAVNTMDGLALYEQAPGSTEWKLVGVSPSPVLPTDNTIITITQHSHGRLRATCTPTAGVSADIRATLIRKN